MPTLRLFIALPLPADVRARLVDVQRQLRERRLEVKWEQPEKLHITMKFIGDMDDIRMPELIEALTVSVRGIAPFESLCRGVGVFPNLREPRIVWAGTDATPPLVQLNEAVETACAILGMPRELRRFHPHVTLGRVKDPLRAGGLTEAINSVMFQPISACSRELHLIKSLLRPEGSTYSLMANIPFST